jgi:two-component system, cell cycle sensor histidine kinase and response regulator CckA
MIRRLVGEDVQVRTLPDGRLRRVRVDPGHIEQVVMNLVINARDAMPHGGVLVLETAMVELDDTYAAAHDGTRPGPHVMLAISDTGSGMDKGVQERIFEPFFTTKGAGKGTGLGLSTVYGIVRQNGGSIWVYSEVGAGTTFKIYLPATDRSAEPLPAAAPSPGTLRGDETVLLVEDDTPLRTVARGILTRHGYRVLDAGGGADALRLHERTPERIDLLLTDVVMPEMSGRVLAERLVTVRPGLRVLYMSGYTDNVIVHHRVVDAGHELLQKPLTPDILLRKVREVLDRPRP